MLALSKLCRRCIELALSMLQRGDEEAFSVAQKGKFGKARWLASVLQPRRRSSSGSGVAGRRFWLFDEPLIGENLLGERL